LRLAAETFIPRKMFGDRETINLFAAAGFEAMDYSLFWHEENSEAYGSGYKAYAHELRTLAEQKGLVFHQTHAPLDCYIFGDESYNHRMLEQTLHAIEFSALLGAEQIIVHPIACPEGINPIEFNLAYYQQLLSTCERFKISVAIENTFARVGAEQKCVCGKRWHYMAF